MSDTEIAPREAGQHDEQVQLRKLFEPIRVGPHDLRHRVVMAPLTRSRASRPGNIPSQLNACYYAQRAAAALIISEATQVSMQGQGYAWTPGIHSREQVEGWRLVADAVHEAGGLMFMQLWHVAKVSSRPASRLARCRSKRCRISCANTSGVRAMQRLPVWTASKCTERTGICSTSFCCPARTAARTNTVDRANAGPGCCSR
jgi:2,4-dienoyl-CoA reductase-like NADH-dependent reductase (Old Yellow Enzyme family)